MPSKKTHRSQMAKAARNRSIRTYARSRVTRAQEAVRSGDSESAAELIRVATSALDRAATKGVIHKNNAARRKSRLMRSLSATAD